MNSIAVMFPVLPNKRDQLFHFAKALRGERAQEYAASQESVASATDSLISALYAHNLAKVALARALGGAEQGIQKLMEVK